MFMLVLQTISITSSMKMSQVLKQSFERNFISPIKLVLFVVDKSYFKTIQTKLELEHVCKKSLNCNMFSLIQFISRTISCLPRLPLNLIFMTNVTKVKVAL